MHFDTVNRFSMVAWSVISCDNDNANALFHQCPREVVGANSAAELRDLEMLMDDEHFHDAKKGKFGCRSRGQG